MQKIFLSKRPALAFLALASSLVLSPAFAQSVPATSAPGSGLRTPTGASSAGKDLNLASTCSTAIARRSGVIMIGGHTGANGLIVGGKPMSIAQGASLTPAMNAALWQALMGGQSLLLSGSGAAVGGSAKLRPAWAGSLSSLVVPAGVSVAAIGFNTSRPLSVSGLASVLGSVYSLQNAPGLTSQMNFGSDLTIGAGGLLSGNLPSNTSVPGVSQLFASQNLVLNVQGSLSNGGTLSVPGTLNVNVGGAFNNFSLPGAGVASISAQNINIVTGSGTILNSGLISASNAINFSTANAATDLLINNSGGTIEALNSINFRDSLFTGNANVDLKGGDWLSQELNVYSGKGAISIDVGKLTGTVNVHGCSAHIGAVTPDLHIGILDVSGDPFIYDNGGDLDLASMVFPADYLVATASGSIYTSSTGTSIDTSSVSGNGGNVVLATGVLATPTESGDVTLDRSGTGGDIFLRAGTTPLGSSTHDITGFDTSSSHAGSDGGNVTLIAVSSTAGGTNGGHIFLPAAVQINTQGAGTGANGNITMIAEAGEQSSEAISIGSIGNGMYGSGGGGNINIKVETPQLAGVAISASTGAISGTLDVEPVVDPHAYIGNYSGNIGIAGKIYSPGSVTVKGRNITTQDAICAPDINLSSFFGSFGEVLINGSLTASNSITVFSDSGLTCTAPITAASSVSLTAHGGGVSLSAPVTATTSKTGIVSLTSGMDITDTGNTLANLFADNISLKSTFGAINLSSSGLAAATSISLDGYRGVFCTGDMLSTQSLVVNGGSPGGLVLTSLSPSGFLSEGGVLMSNTNARAITATSTGDTWITNSASGGTVTVNDCTSSAGKILLTFTGAQSISIVGKLQASTGIVVSSNGTIIENTGSLISAGRIVLLNSTGSVSLMGDTQATNSTSTIVVASSGSISGIGNVTANQILLQPNGVVSVNYAQTGSISVVSQNLSSMLGLNLTSTSTLSQAVQNAVAVNCPGDLTTLNIPASGSISLSTGTPALKTGESGTAFNNTQAGNVDLKQLAGLTLNGKSLTIIATGNIINTGSSNVLDLSGISSNGGSLTLIAGFYCSSQNSPFPISLFGNSTSSPVSGLFTLNGASGNAGNINLGNFNINTSASGKYSAGNITAVATGSISLGNINTSADLQSGTGGKFTAIGNSVSVGTINTAARTSGIVSISSATPQTQGTFQELNGVVTSGSFAPASGSFKGNVLLKSVNAGNADIQIRTGGSGTISQAASTLLTTSALVTINVGTASIPGLNLAAGSMSINTTGSAANATIFDRVPGTLVTSSAGGNLTVTGTSGLDVSGIITTGGSLTVTGTSGLNVSGTITSGGNLVLSNTGTTSILNVSDDCVISAGTLSASGASKTGPLYQNLVTADVAKSGSISLSSAGIVGSNGIVLSDNVQMTANGAGITLTATRAGANITVGDNPVLKANGGSITLSNNVGAVNLGTTSSTSMKLTAISLNGTAGNIAIAGLKGIILKGTGVQVDTLGTLTLNSNSGSVALASGTYHIGSTSAITGSTGLILADSVDFNSSKAIAVTAASAVLGNSDAITAGVLLNASAYSRTSDQIKVADLKSAGGITMTLSGPGGLTGGTNDSIISEGAALSITASTAGSSISLGDGFLVRADGAALTLSSNGSISLVAAGGGGSLNARSVVSTTGTKTGGLVTVKAATGLTIGTNTNVSSSTSVAITASKGAVNLTGASITGGTTVAVAGANGLTVGDGVQITANSGTLTLTNNLSGTGVVSTMSIGNNAQLTASTGVTLSDASTASDMQIENGVLITANNGPVTISAAGYNSTTGVAMNMGDGVTITAKGITGSITAKTTGLIGSFTVGDKYNFSANTALALTSACTSKNAMAIGNVMGGDPASNMTANTTLSISNPGNVTLGSGSIATKAGTTVTLSSTAGAVDMEGTSISAQTAAAISGKTGVTIKATADTVPVVSSLSANTTATVTGPAVLVDNSSITAKTTVAISCTNSVALDNSACVSGLTGVTVSTSAVTGSQTITIGTGVNLTAGKSNAAVIGPILDPTLIPNSGSLVLSAAVVNVTGDNNLLISNGRDLKVTASGTSTATPLAISGTSNTFQANGGNVQLLSKGLLDAGTGNTFYARSIGATASASTGAGIELGSGLTTSAAITTAFGKTAGIRMDSASFGTGVTFNNLTGVMQVNLPSAGIGAIVQLNGSTLSGDRGVQVFDAASNTSAVNATNCTFKTEALKPAGSTSLVALGEETLSAPGISLNRAGSITHVAVGDAPVELHVMRAGDGGSMLVPVKEMSVNTGKDKVQIFARPGTRLTHSEDGALYLSKGEVFLNASNNLPIETAHVKVEATKGALAAVQVANGCTYVRVCSANGLVSVLVDGKTIELNSGEEILVSNHAPDELDIHPTDGLGRRNTRSVPSDKHHVTISEFSIISMISNHEVLCSLHNARGGAEKRMLDRLLKTAASVDTVLKYRGCYSAR